MDGDCAYTVYQEGTTAERFAEYLKTKLLPTLSEADIIVMDNMCSHHAKVVKQLLDSSKVTYLYLPPYSPDLNPIEKMWSKLKAFLRKEKQQKNADEELENIAAVKKQMTPGKA